MNIHQAGQRKRLGQDERTWAEIGRQYGKTGEQMRDIARKRVYYAEKNNRILHICDLHVPFHRKEILDDLRPYAGRVDTLVIGGDEQDSYAISKFPKEFRIPFGEEMIETSDLLVAIIELLQPLRVVLITGNHNRRLLRYFRDKIDESILDIIPNTNLDYVVDLGIVSRDRRRGITYERPALRKRLPDVEITYTGKWYAQIGGTVFCHPDSYKGGPMRTVEGAVRHLHELGLTFDCVVMAHTHHLGTYFIGDTMTIESGCLCVSAKHSEAKMTRPWQPGFVYLVHGEDGRVIREKVKLIDLPRT